MAQDLGDEKKKRPPVPDDADISERWIQTHRNTAYGNGEWRRYKNGYWPPIEVDVVRNEVTALIRAAKEEGVRASSYAIASVVELARIQVARPADAWDANPNLLVFRNGVLDITTSTLGPHTPNHLITSGLDYDYDPRAPEPIVWYSVLEKCLPADAIAFFQEFAGLCLTTEQRYETAVWLYGAPGGGKSTILGGVQTVLGHRAGVIGLADIERSRFALSGLPGLTLAISTEQPSDYAAASHTLNAIISGEPIIVDRKFRDPVTIIPKCKLLWAMNTLPKVGSANDGLFRRIKVINVPKIPQAERDATIKELLPIEAPGILNWALAGLRRLNARGRFEIPASVEKTTASFVDMNDVAAQFVADECVTGKNHFTGETFRCRSSELYEAYREWCIKNGHKPAASNTITREWERLGFLNVKPGNRSWWMGVTLREHPMGV